MPLSLEGIPFHNSIKIFQALYLLLVPEEIKRKSCHLLAVPCTCFPALHFI